MARFAPTLGEALNAQAANARNTSTTVMSTPAMDPVEMEDLGPVLAQNVTDLNTNKTDVANALTDLNTQLATANTNISQAQTDVVTAKSAADAAQTSADSAQAKADQASTDAATAQASANSAATAASTADGKAVTAKSAADAAQASANAAQTAANSASTAASTADGKAVNAQTAATNAQTAANNAAATANANTSKLNGWTTTGQTTIDGGQITTDSVTAGQIAAGAITASELAANAVTAASIKAGEITAGKLVAGTLTSASGVFGDINASSISSGTINAARLVAGDIRTLFLTAGKVTAADIVAGTLTSASGVFGDINASSITSGTINAARLVAGDVRAAFLSAGKVTAADMVAGTLTSASGVFGTMDASVINAGTLNVARLNGADVRAAVIAAGKITASDITAGTITGNEIAANAITATKILAGEIGTNHMTAGAINGDRITAGTIVAGHLSATAIDGKTITGADIRTSGLSGNVYGHMGPNAVKTDPNAPAYSGIGFNVNGSGAQTFDAGMWSKDGVKLSVGAGGSANAMSYMSFGDNGYDINAYSYGNANMTSRGSVSITNNGPAGAAFVTGNNVYLQTPSNGGTIDLGGNVTVKGQAMSGGVVQTWNSSGTMPNQSVTKFINYTLKADATTDSTLFSVAANGYDLIARDTGVYDITVMMALGAAATGRSLIEISQSADTYSGARAAFTTGEDTAAVTLTGLRMTAGKTFAADAFVAIAASTNYGVTVRITKVAAPTPQANWSTGDQTLSGTLNVQGKLIQPVRTLTTVPINSGPPNATQWGPGVMSADTSRSSNYSFASFPTNDTVQINETGTYAVHVICYIGDNNQSYRPYLLVQEINPTVIMGATEKPISTGAIGHFTLSVANWYLTAGKQFQIKFQQNSGSTKTWTTTLSITKLQ